MLDANGRAQDIERLRTLLDRLGSADITLAEAKGLRESVLGLVAERASSSARGERFALARPPVSARVLR